MERLEFAGSRYEQFRNVARHFKEVDGADTHCGHGNGNRRKRSKDDRHVHAAVPLHHLARVSQTFARNNEYAGTGTASHYAKRLNSLTPREREVLPFIATGQSSKRIACELGGSFNTIEVHRARFMRKMAATTVAHLVRMSVGKGNGRGQNLAPDHAKPALAQTYYG